MSVASLTLALVAAGVVETPHGAPAMLGARSWLDFGLRGGIRVDDRDEDRVFGSAELDALLCVGPGHVMLGLAVASFIRIDEDWDDQVVLANPFIGFTFPVASHVRLMVGAALPFIDGDEHDDSAVATGASFAANARHPWTWAASRLSFTVGANVDAALGAHAALDGELHLGAMIPVGVESGDPESSFVIDAEVGVRVSLVRLGLGFVFIDTGARDRFFEFDEQASDVRVSGALGVRVPVGDGIFYADFTVALDEPAFFEDEAVPSLMLGWTSPL